MERRCLASTLMHLRHRNDKIKFTLLFPYYLILYFQRQIINIYVQTCFILTAEITQFLALTHIQITYIFTHSLPPTSISLIQSPSICWPHCPALVKWFSVASCGQSIQMQINSKYEILEKVGNGNFSTVFTARQYHTGQVTALKVMKTHQNIALKQAYLLKTFEHPNIVKVFDFQQDPTSGETRMALQYLPQNTLELYQQQRYGLRQQQVKCILFQTALGLAYIHQRGIIHRDVKPQNILIDKTTAEIKLIDFGLAIPTHKISTDYVATRWYRAPENLLGTKEYTPAIDVFSLACVAVELYLGAPLFPGADNIDQLHKIFNVLGEPREEDWSLGYRKCLELGLRVGDKKYQIPLGLGSVLKPGSESFLNLMSQMLALNPSKRISSRDMIHHSYFKDVKLIVPPHIFKRFEKDHLGKVKSRQQIQTESHQSEHKNSINKEATATTKPQNTTVNMQKESLTLAHSPRKAMEQQSKVNEQKSKLIKKNCKEPQINLNNALNFRGFHPIKTNKISVKQVQKQIESTSKNKNLQKDSRNNSIDSTKVNASKNFSNSIDLTRKIINKNITQPPYIMERRFTSEGRDFRTPDVKTYSNDKARNIYFHSPAVLAPAKAAPYKPIKSFLMESLSTLEPQAKYTSISPYESGRMVRNNSEINAPSHRRMVAEVKPVFVGREREKTSVSPSSIAIHAQSPIPFNKPLENPIQAHKQTIYTMPVDRQREKAAISFANNFFRKERQNASFQTQDHNISFHQNRINQNRSRILLNNVEIQRHFQKGKEPRQDFSPFPPARTHNHFQPKLEPKTKIPKSLEHRQMADVSKIRTNGLLNVQNGNSDQRPSMVIEKKQYRQPRIITNRYLHKECRGPSAGPNEPFQRETDRNISINLNLSIVERQKSKDSSLIKEREAGIMRERDGSILREKRGRI